MSVHVMDWVLRHSEEKLGRRLVLLVLADHANTDGTGAWPSVDTIAREARLSRRQTQTCLRELVKSGAIAEAGTSAQGTRIYDVLMGGADSAPRAESGAGEGAETAPEPSLVQEQPSEVQELDPPKGPPALTKIDGRNVAWDALAEECGIVEDDPRSGELAVALNTRTGQLGIRALFWGECIRYAEQRVDADPGLRIEMMLRLRRFHDSGEDFERALERAIHLKAQRYRTAMPGAMLTPGALRKWWVSLERMRPDRGGLTPEEIERLGSAL
jgi:hypothetical protein